MAAYNTALVVMASRHDLETRENDDRSGRDRYSTDEWRAKSFFGGSDGSNGTTLRARPWTISGMDR